MKEVRLEADPTLGLSEGCEGFRAVNPTGTHKIKVFILAWAENRR